ncbi:MarR family winged helix-turn-helix transcriptional regulator [Streptomyces mirabilis]|uniref:MarR family winged helix-turn-helix transcriptional regulator n=1 Tax=Streptomyces mirabilis TaxID=68239 RepID=UPI0036C65402
METLSGSGSGDIPSAARIGPVSYAIFRISRMHRMLAGHLLRDVGLHPRQALVMRKLWERGGMRQVDLAELVGSDPATMTRTVKRLERAGLVCRIPSPTDKRSVIVEPTAAGRELRHKVESTRTDLEHQLTNGLSEAARAEVLAVLERLERNLAPGVGDDADCPIDADEPSSAVGTPCPTRWLESDRSDER